MKTVLLIPAILLCTVCSSAQQDCFETRYRKGKTACGIRQFSTAIQQFTAARDCSDKPPNTDLEDWIRRSQQGLDERKAWYRAVNADSRESYRRYLDHYPGGYYQQRAGDALKRLEDISEKPVRETTPSGSIDWTQEYVEASGQAVINREKWPNEAQAIAMATRGAEVLAKANLLETAAGVQIRRSTTVKDMMTESDLIQTQVQGVVKSARPVGEPLVANGMVTVTLRMPVNGPGGLTASLLPNAPTLPDHTFDLPDTEPVELILRVGTVKQQPVLFPSFTNENGALLLDGATFGRQYGEPAVRYVQTVDMTSEARIIDVSEDAQGNWVLPASATSDFQNWLKIRESGGGVVPIRVLSR